MSPAMVILCDQAFSGSSAEHVGWLRCRSDPCPVQHQSAGDEARGAKTVAGQIWRWRLNGCLELRLKDMGDANEHDLDTHNR